MNFTLIYGLIILGYKVMTTFIVWKTQGQPVGGKALYCIGAHLLANELVIVRVSRMKQIPISTQDCGDVGVNNKRCDILCSNQPQFSLKSATLYKCWSDIINWNYDNIHAHSEHVQNEPVGCWGSVWCCSGWRHSVRSRTSQARWQLLGRSCRGAWRSHWASEGNVFGTDGWVGRVTGNPCCSFISSCVVHFFNGRGSWQVTTTFWSLSSDYGKADLGRCFKVMKNLD